jgi:hypothetical protein
MCVGTSGSVKASWNRSASTAARLLAASGQVRMPALCCTGGRCLLGVAQPHLGVLRRELRAARRPVRPPPRVDDAVTVPHSRPCARCVAGSATPSSPSAGSRRAVSARYAAPALGSGVPVGGSRYSTAPSASHSAARSRSGRRTAAGCVTGGSAHGRRAADPNAQGCSRAKERVRASVRGRRRVASAPHKRAVQTGCSRVAARTS